MLFVLVQDDTDVTKLPKGGRTSFLYQVKNILVLFGRKTNRSLPMSVRCSDLDRLRSMLEAVDDVRIQGADMAFRILAEGSNLPADERAQLQQTHSRMRVFCDASIKNTRNALTEVEQLRQRLQCNKRKKSPSRSVSSSRHTPITPKRPRTRSSPRPSSRSSPRSLPRPSSRQSPRPSPRPLPRSSSRPSSRPSSQSPPRRPSRSPSRKSPRYTTRPRRPATVSPRAPGGTFMPRPPPLPAPVKKRPRPPFRP